MSGDYLGDIGKVVSAQSAMMHKNDLVRATALKDEMNNLMASFRGFGAPNYDKSHYIGLMKRFEQFELTVISLNYMVYFYGYMGRVALNCLDLEKATMYAMACAEVCASMNDEEGLISSKRLLCDIALTVGSTLYAGKYFSESHPGEVAPFKAVVSKNEDKAFERLMNLKKRPPTFKHMANKESMERESTLRFMMLQLKVGRQAAKRYLGTT